MSKIALEIGDIVRLETGEWAGEIGIVNKTITIQSAGHGLVFGEGYILGVPAQWMI